MAHRIRLDRALPLLTTCLVMAVAEPALAQDRGEPDADGLGTHQKNIRADIGLRTQFVANAGLDPFSENDVLPQLALGASWGFYASEQLSVAAMFGFDYGSLSARARSNDTSLALWRFALGPEVRYHLLRVLALTARVSPTLTRQSAEISSGIDTDLHKVAWKFGFDATAGAAVELYGYRSGASRKPRVWVTAEGGYGWTAPTKMVFEPIEASGAPQRLVPLELEDLSLSGPLFRVTAALSFW
jgi:hypothetical protein